MATATITQPTAMPTRKMSAVAFSLPVTPLLVWLLRDLAGVDIPDPAIAALGSAVSFIFGYFTKNAAGDR